MSPVLKEVRPPTALWTSLKNRGRVREKLAEIRIGIDVGGTFTKGVALDSSGRILAKEVTLTTHRHPKGVVAGVVEVFRRLTRYVGSGDRISFVGFSTSQPVNALFEGDVSPVGILAVAADGKKAALRATNMRAIRLQGGKDLPLPYRLLNPEKVDREVVQRAVAELREEGAMSVVATVPYGIDVPEVEDFIIRVTREVGLPAVAGHEMSMVYGLQIRTQTACLNAALVPKMSQVAEIVEEALREQKINAPLTVMRGDGGIMGIEEFKVRPLHAVYSGPAASLAGALYCRSRVHSVFIEVGGTTTNVGIIKQGQPLVDYVRIGEYPTCIRSLYITVLPLGGGSMPRVRGGKLRGVGPRSAHIAGLEYASFTPRPIAGQALLTAPMPSDPKEYLVVQPAHQDPIAVTLTCAANAVGLTLRGQHAHGNPEKARQALALAADYLGSTWEDLAWEMLETAVETSGKAVLDMAGRAGLPSVELVGGGGAAAALIPALAKYLEVPYTIVENADVISSIGVASALLRSEMEYAIRDVPDIAHVLNRAEKEAKVRLGDGGTPIISTQYIPDRDSLRVTILGSALSEESRVGREDARELGAQALSMAASKLQTIYESPVYYIFGSYEPGILGTKQSFAVVDRHGAIPFVAPKGRLLLDHEGGVPVPPWDLSLGFSRACLVRGPHCIILPVSLATKRLLRSIERLQGQSTALILAGGNG
jgi:N-methylhydantoinase A/oxoprolinase/acetone carboxylase beta subunit